MRFKAEGKCDKKQEQLTSPSAKDFIYERIPGIQIDQNPEAISILYDNVYQRQECLLSFL